MSDRKPTISHSQVTEQVSLSANAFAMLKKLAARENLTDSQDIEKHFSKALKPAIYRRSYFDILLFRLQLDCRWAFSGDRSMSLLA